MTRNAGRLGACLLPRLPVTRGRKPALPPAHSMNQLLCAAHSSLILWQTCWLGNLGGKLSCDDWEKWGYCRLCWLSECWRPCAWHSLRVE
jgi:hypothetical protein